MKTNKYIMFFVAALMLAACEPYHFVGDAPKEWSSMKDIITPSEDAGFSTYYLPAIGRVGDPMPFYDENAGDFKVLYLQEYSVNDDKRFHPIWAVSTKDGCNYQSLGEILPVGETRLQQDAALGTGCCYYSKAEKLYYLYYTGHNGLCSSREVVMRATSTDFKNWTKDNIWELRGETYGLSKEDFRDPQIFEDNGTFHMVISSYIGKDPRFVDFVSTNLRDWEFNGVFNMVWDRFCECPDIFKMGDWWYLVYSEAFKKDFSRKVKYMKAKTLQDLKNCFNDPGGNWPDEHEGILETRAFYAGKTAYNGKDRFIWGWSPFRTGSSYHDKNLAVGADGEPNWSGALVCHKLIQHADGTLSVGEVPGMADKFTKPAEVKVLQSENYTDGALKGNAYVLFNRLGYHNHISLTVTTETNKDNFGISFARGTEIVKLKNEQTGEMEDVVRDATRYYTLFFASEWEGGRRKVNFEQQGSEGRGFIPGADGYIIPVPDKNTYKIDIFTDNSVVVTYINGEWGTTQRIYGLAKNCWGINSYGGNITVSDLKVTQY